MTELYFDSNVYARIADEGSVNAVKQWLRQDGLRLRVSESLMTEAFRIPDAQIRQRRFDAITQLATNFPMPGAFLSVRELVSSVKRHRPQWLRADPDTKVVSQFLNLDRNTWRHLKADGAHYPKELAQPLTVIHASVGEIRGRQRKTRSRLQEALMVPAEALSPEGAEDYWRASAAMQLISALFPERSLERYSVLHRAYLDSSRMTPDDLASFFQKDVEADEMPRQRILGLTDYFQRRYTITAGNWMDQGHAVELLNADILVTRDETFHKGPPGRFRLAKRPRIADSADVDEARFQELTRRNGSSQTRPAIPLSNHDQLIVSDRDERSPRDREVAKSYSMN